MVKIDKSLNVPTILDVIGKTKTIELCDAFDRNTAGYSKAYHKTRNPYKFNFDADIYANPIVKEQIKAEQGKKCCFCENKDFDDVAFGDVEHYRPKASYANGSSDKTLRYPGYYWLAYDWKNLMFSCQICNQRHKGNYFPLINGTVRTLHHSAKLEDLDNTLLINPLEENPEKHLGFREEIIYNIDSSAKGLNSIEYYGLDRSLLDKKRRAHLETVKANIVLAKIEIENIPADKINEVMEDLGATRKEELQEIINRAKNYVAVAAKKDAAFSLMVRCNFPRLPQ